MVSVVQKESLRLEILKIVSARPVQSMEQMVNMAKALETYVLGEDSTPTPVASDISRKGIKAKPGNPDILS